jgi:hypothetical protein
VSDFFPKKMEARPGPAQYMAGFRGNYRSAFPIYGFSFLPSPGRKNPFLPYLSAKELLACTSQ